MIKKFFFALPFLTLLLSTSCENKEPKGNSKPTQNAYHPIKFTHLKNNAQFNEGGIIPINVTIENARDLKDSITVYWDHQKLFTVAKKEKIEYDFDTSDKLLGQHTIKVTATGNDGKTYGDTRKVVIFSSSEPLQTQAQIIQSYPHNTTSYTQGLEFNHGNLWEGTGNYGESILAQVDLTTGNAIRSKKIEKEYFGEGITIFNNKIYQLTYKAGKCFVYDLVTLERINSFSYAGEGWGLTHNDSLIIMSNGSHQLFFKDPETFETVKTIQAFSNRRDFGNLNELEWIDGFIYANIYTTTSIVKIDPSNGQVKEVIDCSSVVNDVMAPGIDVLNGIAYNPLTQKIYITGKFWSKLYEVSFSVTI